MSKEIIEEIKLRISLNKSLTKKHIDFLKNNPRILPKVNRNKNTSYRKINNKVSRTINVPKKVSKSPKLKNNVPKIKLPPKPIIKLPKK